MLYNYLVVFDKMFYKFKKNFLKFKILNVIISCKIGYSFNLQSEVVNIERES